MNLFNKFLYTLVCIASNLGKVDSARILGLFPTHSRSHLIIHSAIAEALAENGHNVTVVSNHISISKNLKYRYIFLDVPPMSDEIFSTTINKQPSFFKAIIKFIRANLDISNASLHHPLMQKLMDEESFDLVLHGYFMNDFLFGVAAHFKCPLVLSYSTRLVSNTNDFVGNPQELAYVPNLISSATQPMSFYKRLNNFISVQIFHKILFSSFLKLIQELYYKSNFPSDKFPSLDAMKKNVSLIFTAHHFSQGPIRPDVPAVIEIGGIQIKDKPGPLPKDIKSILDNSTQNGAIYFSLGTNIDKNHLDPSKVKIIFEVLSKLPQTVLCKWGDPEVPIESANLFYKKWLPQADVLHHSNVKLFITHGGLGGITEAKYHGVPMVGIPLFNDQYANMGGVQTAGFGLSLDYATLSNKILRNAIEEVLSNRTYSENVKLFSRLYRDRPLTPKQTAVYWVEYVLRHHGAPHLQSPAIHMNTIQLMSLDVIGFLLTVLFITCKVLKIIYLYLKRMYCENKIKNE